MLSIYLKLFKKAMIERKDLLSSKFSDKCEKCLPRNFRRSWKILGQLQKFISGMICVKCRGEGVDLNTLNVLRTTRAMLMIFCIVNTPKCQILIVGCKVHCLFQQIFVYEKINK